MRFTSQFLPSALALAASGMLVVFGAASCVRTSPTLPSPENEAAPAAPRPVSPINNAVAGRQNDPTTGCPATDLSRGTGLTIEFTWEPVSGAVGYLGCYWHGDDGNEALDCPRIENPLPAGAFYTADPRARLVGCGFVGVNNLSGWHWKVAARSSSSGWGPYSPTMDFMFTPCFQANGQRCMAPS